MKIDNSIEKLQEDVILIEITKLPIYGEIIILESINYLQILIKVNILKN